MEGRLIVVSNRMPLGGAGSGGLVVALHEALSAEGGVWIGSEEAEVADDEFHRHEEDVPYEKLTFTLDADDHAEYYLGYANSVLWPLCHRRSDLIDYEARFRAGYDRVNRRLAEMLTRILQPDDRLWVHDYHFFPLAAHLRALGVENRIGFFLHIPFPNGSDLLALPDRESFPGWISAYDVVGLQTQRDVATCLEMFRSDVDAEMMLDGAIKHDDRLVELRSFPIGIDVEVMRSAAGEGEGGADTRLKLDARERLLIGVDRLDYSKGLVKRLQAFGVYLDKRPPDAARATLLQIAPPTREDVRAYAEIRDELERLTGAINGRHSEIDWTPIRYIHRQVPREVLATLFRRASVGLVTPLADGMNLVAKEYVASQNPDDPGVLILSRFAGAAEQLDQALIVNPYDTDEMAQAIEQALKMPLEERKMRHESMLAEIEAHDIAWWSSQFLRALEGRDVRNRQRDA
ncbi:alpha,alpha-trehalose-phosphate synthase (UDP-forming) [Roseitranquillus sediminis]|uniref:alpha,alpha-trehalose-phosphate synthase (UDP-forming) n=1 Tax=Roseitranquillus sediminis TaxID=2809051 RepID=UPI001D0CC001|nr:trehalose-6-phosphate synthase [Roseitranquillus sediminis]MBM9593451.1 trehalose-6-phosphate synthase [Roseitranquillus sediminis]